MAEKALRSLAVVTTSAARPSGIGDYARGLLPELAAHVDLQVFVEPGADSESIAGVRTQSLDSLDPAKFDHVLFQLGNEMQHAFMAHAVRRLGGVVALHDWVLFDMAVAAFPALARGGLRGAAAALREGGLRETLRYGRGWLKGRALRSRAQRFPSCDPAGPFVSGWYALESGGRWSADEAWLKLPDGLDREIEIRYGALGGERVELVETDGNVAPRTLAIGASAGGKLVARDLGAASWLGLRTQGVHVTRRQRQSGDSRRLGCFVEEIRLEGSRGSLELDLALPCAHPPAEWSLSAERFALPLNRSIICHADSFIVHSQYVKELVLETRNAPTPIEIIPHGAAPTWSIDRMSARERLGIPRDVFLLLCFGAVQPHKRIDRVLEALSRAAPLRPDLRLAIVGKPFPLEFDSRARAQALGVIGLCRFEPFVEESAVADWLAASSVAINLRGPTSGGSSGAVHRAFAAGRAVIASDAAEQRELPPGCTIKIPHGASEVELLVRHWIELAENRDRLAVMERAACAYAETIQWKRVARSYADSLAGFPRIRASRRDMNALRRKLRALRARRAGTDFA